MTTKADPKQIIDVVVNTEADQEEKIEGAIVFRFESFLFTNCGETVFTVDYLKINERKYNCIYKTSIKPNDNAQIYFKPMKIFQTNINAQSIRIGVTDIQNNKYEYELLFEITDNKIQDTLKNICSYSINIKSVDCSKNLYKEKKTKRSR